MSASTGDLGILADHVPAVLQLKPGLIEIFQSAGDKTQKYFVSGGFAVVNPDSTLNINAVEAFTVEQLDVDAAKKAVEETNRKLTGNLTDAQKASLKAELEVYEAVVALKK